MHFARVNGNLVVRMSTQDTRKVGEAVKEVLVRQGGTEGEPQATDHALGKKIAQQERARLASAYISENIARAKAHIGVPPLYAGKFATRYQLGGTAGGSSSAFAGWKDFGGLVLVGPAGTGKTTALSCWLEEALPEFVRYGKLSARWVSASDLLMEVKKAISLRRGESAVLQGYIRPSLLVLDDFGTHYETEWSTSLFYHLLESRLNTCGYTALSTPVELARWRQWDPRIASRLSLFKVIECLGLDKRRLTASRRFLAQAVEERLESEHASQ